MASGVTGYILLAALSAGGGRQVLAAKPLKSRSGLLDPKLLSNRACYWSVTGSTSLCQHIKCDIYHTVQDI